MSTPFVHRPTVMGSRYMASTGHYLATAAALRILNAGGNAFDAGVAAGLCLNVVQPEYTNIGGVAPIILYSARDDRIRAISGLGHWPRNFSISYFTDECDGDMPPSVQRCVVPAAIDAWLTALRDYGTMTLADVAAPAIALADDGFPVSSLLHANLVGAASMMSRWSTNSEIFLPGGRAPISGARLVQRDLARTLRLLVETETDNRRRGREDAIQAARDRFYRGDIAERIAAFVADEGGFLSIDDLANFSVDVEAPLSVPYRGFDVFGCGAWCQGPVVLETLSILQGYDLGRFTPGSADVLHLILEALKAAFADREAFYGDPKFVDVPLAGLLDADYASAWRERIDTRTASPGMPIPGDPWAFQELARTVPERSLRISQSTPTAVRADTSYVCVVDAAGNAFSATPSDGVGETPVVPGLGFVLSDRGIQSWLDADHPSAIAPGKRPRLTPNPGLVMRDGQVVAPYGTPGGDVQPQAMVQFLVNLIDFNMEPQAAIEAPRVATYSFPESVHPHPYFPGRVMAEARISPDILDDLRRRGHQVERWPDWAAAAGAVCAVVVDRQRGALLGGADPRRLAYAAGW